MNDPKSLPHIVILATGGTIAGKGESSLELTSYKAGVLGPDQLLASVPELQQYAKIHAEQLSSLDSKDMSIAIWLELAERINILLSQDDVDGIVVTHGTDTMEETAYFLHLTIKSSKPVVLVGAMRPPSAVSSDGPLNLLQAVMLAGHKDAAGRGVLVLLNGEINSARDVSKTSTTQVETFRSNDLGFLGYFSGNSPSFYWQASRKHTSSSEFSVSGLKSLPKVGIVYQYADPSLDALRGIINGKPAGIVVAGTGNGSIFEAAREMLAKAAREGIVVLRSSRTGTGIVTPDPQYDRDHLLSADNLNPQKARILLMLALTRSKDFSEIERIFRLY